MVSNQFFVKQGPYPLKKIINLIKCKSSTSQINNVNVEPVQTNLVFFSINVNNPLEISIKLKEKGINGGNANNRWRFVPHYGLSKKDIDYVAKTMNELINNI